MTPSKDAPAAEQALDAGPAQEQLYQKALGQYRAGDYSAASKSFRRLLKREPGHDRASYGLGISLRESGRSPEALLPLRRACELQPGRPDYREALGEILLRLDQPAQAAALLSGEPTAGLQLLAARVQAHRQPALRFGGPITQLGGSRAGLRQPVMLVPLQVSALPAGLPNLPAIGAELIGRDLPALPPEPIAGLGQSLLDWAVTLQASAGQPVFERGALLSAEAPASLVMVMPYDDSESGLQAIRWALRVHIALLGLPAELQPPLLAQLARECEALQRAFRQRASGAGTIKHLLAAAHARGLPWRRVSFHGFIYQLGQGAQARLLNSTLTDQTPGIGVQMARSKPLSLDLLRQLGLPVPRHALAQDAEAAVALADRLGYPVVVKPAQLDQGKGVAAGLRDADAVRRAYAAAVAASSEFGAPAGVLVEQFIAGQDYRLLVAGGRLLFAIHRQPGGVSGDGRRTIIDLLTELNADPRRGDDERSPLRRVALDAEARELLAEQGLSPEAVPAAGRWVPLRRIANVVQGGLPVGVLEQVHPSNQRLAVRAAAALGLDLAGIDLIIPDIARPWHEAGGAICEINAQPSIGTLTTAQVFPELLDWLLGGSEGRIPIAALVGEPDQSAAIGAGLHALLCARGIKAGLASRAGAWVGAEQVCWKDRSGFAGSRLLLSERAAEAALLTLSPAGIARTGLCFDRSAAVALLPGILPLAREQAVALSELLAGTQAVVLPASALNELEALLPAHEAPRLIALADDARDPDLLRHCAAGGEAVWQEGPRLLAGSPERQLTLPELPASVAAGSAAYVAALAYALGHFAASESSRPEEPRP